MSYTPREITIGATIFAVLAVGTMSSRVLRGAFDWFRYGSWRSELQESGVVRIFDRSGRIMPALPEKQPSTKRQHICGTIITMMLVLSTIGL